MRPHRRYADRQGVSTSCPQEVRGFHIYPQGVHKCQQKLTGGSYDIHMCCPYITYVNYQKQKFHNVRRSCSVRSNAKISRMHMTGIFFFHFFQIVLTQYFTYLHRYKKKIKLSEIRQRVFLMIFAHKLSTKSFFITEILLLRFS